MTNKPDEISEVASPDEMLSRLREIFDRSRSEVLRASKLSKARIDLIQARRERQQQFQELGQAAYRLMKAGRVEADELLPAYLELKTNEARITELESLGVKELEAEIEAAVEEAASAAEEAIAAPRTPASTTESAGSAEGGGGTSKAKRQRRTRRPERRRASGRRARSSEERPEAGAKVVADKAPVSPKPAAEAKAKAAPKRRRKKAGDDGGAKTPTKAARAGAKADKDKPKRASKARKPRAASAAGSRGIKKTSASS